MTPVTFCKCGAKTKLVRRESFCIKTEQNAKICDGMFHGNAGCRTFTKAGEDEIDDNR